MKAIVGGEHLAALHHRLTACEIADESAGLAHQQEAGSEIPRRQSEFPEAVISAGGHISEIECGGAKPAYPAGCPHDCGKRREKGRVVVASDERDASADQCLAELPAR